MNYYIADLHLNCTNKYEGRTLEYDQLIKENWNKRVTNADTVFILGDIGKEGGNKYTEYLCEIISTLKGKKVLIQGNHDKLKDSRIKQLFAEVIPYKEVSDNINGTNKMLTLSHYPMLLWNGQHKEWIHLYGHVHTSKEWNIYKESLKLVNDYFSQRRKDGFTDCPPAKAFNVGSMLPYMDYTPRTLKEILENAEVGYE